MTSSHVQFQADSPLDRELEARVGDGGDPGATARRDLQRYYALLEHTRLTLNFTENEYLLMMEALNGSIFDENVAGLIWAEVEDGIRMDHLDEKYGVDGQELIRRLRGLTLSQNMTFADAAERFWDRSTEEDQRKRLRLVGLIR